MIDIGANLTKFDDDEVSAVIHKSKQTGLRHIVITGTSLDSTFAAKELVNRFDHLFFTAGCHPHYAKRWQSIHLELMDTFLRHPKCIYIGETGLDYYRMLSTKEEQEYSFRAQIELALQYQMPLFLHERNAHHDFLRILDDYTNLPPVIVHCFTGNSNEVEEYIKRGFYIGITGWICDDKRGASLQKAIALVPDNRILVETDAPYLTPKGIWTTYIPHELKNHAGYVQNEPSTLLAVIHACAHFRSQTFEHVRTCSTNNALALINHKKEITFKFEDVYNWN